MGDIQTPSKRSNRTDSTASSETGRSSCDDVPEWIMRRVDDVVADNLFKVQSSLYVFRRRVEEHMREQTKAVQQQESKIQDVLSRVQKVLGAQASDRSRLHECERALEGVKMDVQQSARTSTVLDLIVQVEMLAGTIQTVGKAVDGTSCPVDSKVLDQLHSIEERLSHSSGNQRTANLPQQRSRNCSVDQAARLRMPDLCTRMPCDIPKAALGDKILTSFHLLEPQSSSSTFSAVSHDPLDMAYNEMKICTSLAQRAEATGRFARNGTRMKSMDSPEYRLENHSSPRGAVLSRSFCSRAVSPHNAV